MNIRFRDLNLFVLNFWKTNWNHSIKLNVMLEERHVLPVGHMAKQEKFQTCKKYALRIHY